MKRVVILDSGLGGLNVAARYFAPGLAGEPCELVYFNAYPSPDGGFNKLPTDRAREDLLQEVFSAVADLAPDRCILACNTLSIVAERLFARFRPPFPVLGIVDAAASGMRAALERDPSCPLLILGTQSTVDSGLYAARLTAAGIAPERIRSLACPGLATLLESGPASPEVAARIRTAAHEAAALFPVRPARLLLGLCCTHFGFAKLVWRREFANVFGGQIEIVDPNGLLGGECPAASFRYLAKIGLFPGAAEGIGAVFRHSAPPIAEALQNARPMPDLFKFEK